MNQDTHERPTRRGEKGQEAQAQEYINEVDSDPPTVLPQHQTVEREGSKTYEAFADHYQEPTP